MSKLMIQRFAYQNCFVLVVSALLTGACSREKDRSDTKDASPQNHPASMPTTRLGSIDWSKVTSLSQQDSMGMLMKITRLVTAKYQGTKKIVHISIVTDGTAKDEFGNEYAVSAPAWKGIVKMINTASARPIGMLTPRASTLDGLGDLPKRTYDVDVDDENTIQFVDKGLFHPEN